MHNHLQHAHQRTTGDKHHSSESDRYDPVWVRHRADSEADRHRCSSCVALPGTIRDMIVVVVMIGELIVIFRTALIVGYDGRPQSRRSFTHVWRYTAGKASTRPWGFPCWAEWQFTVLCLKRPLYTPASRIRQNSTKKSLDTSGFAIFASAMSSKSVKKSICLAT